MSRLSLYLIENSPQFVNTLKDREIDLRSNNLTIIENLGITKDSFDTIDLSDNSIYRLENFPLLKRLKNLYASNNRINVLGNSLGSNLPELEALVLTNNKFEKLEQLEPLKNFKRLINLSLEENAVQKTENYRLFVIKLLPSLKYFDFRKVKEKERELAQKLFDGEGKENTFVPGEKENAEKKELTEREKEVFRAAIDNAKTVSEINRLEQFLLQGILPQELKSKL